MAKIEITPEETVKYLDLVGDYLTDDQYTAYGISSILNRILEKDGKAPVRSQMMYNYARNGLIVPGEKISGQTLRTFTKAEVGMFLIRYCLRNQVTLGETVSDDQLSLFDIDTTTDVTN